MNKEKRHFGKLAKLGMSVLYLALACPPLAVAQAPAGAANDIRSVWNLSLQPCNGGGGNLMVRNADEATIKSTRKIILKDAGFQIAVPQLPELERTHVKLFLNDKSRGVTDHYVLLSPGDLAPPIAAIVVTELPSNMRSNASGLRAAADLQVKSSRGAPFSFSRLTGPFGESIELLVPNRIGSHCFPTADFQVSPDASVLNTLGISRFSVIGDKLVEFALIMRIPSGTSKEKAIADARKLMDSYWTSLSTLL
ncbi:hypothetical protein [Polaromonas sp. P5_D5]